MSTVEIRSDQEVIPGQLIAVVNLPTYGKSGTTIEGKAIPAEKGRFYSVIPGRNTYTSPDGTRIYSMSYGYVFWEDNVINVDQVRIIEKDLTENINLKGTLIVKGSIKSNVVINTEGSVIVKGNVEDVQISAGGLINIEGEVDGGGRRAILSAGDKIYASGIKSADLEANKIIFVKDLIFNSKIKADKIICNNKGLVVKSRLEAKSLIYIKTAGKSTISGLQAEFVVNNTDGKIYILNNLYPKVSIKIGQITTVIKKPYKCSLFFIEKGRLSINKAQIEDINSLLEINSTDCINVKESQFEKEIPCSIVLEVQDEYSAKKMAAELLQIKVENLEAQKLKHYLFRVFEKEKIGPWTQEWLSKYGPDKDGSFSFENKLDGLYLIVTPAIGKGKKVTPDEILAFAQKKGYEGIDIEKVKECCYKRLNESIKIASRQIIKEAVKIEVTKDKDKAYATILKPKEGGLLIKMDDVIYALNKAKVVVGIKQEKITEALQLGIFDEKIEVAEAIPPEEPTEKHNAQIIYKYTENLGREVIPGQMLIKKTLPQYPKPGMNVLGEEIPSTKGKDIKLLPGRRVYLAENGREIYSLFYGRVFWEELPCGLRVDVDPLKEIPHDIETNYEYDGSLRIKGSIGDDKKLKIRGNLEVEGNIGSAEIISDGDVIIKGDVEGRGKARIRAENFYANSVKDSLIEADGLVHIKEAIYNCTIKAKDIVCEGRGGILDSRLLAKDLIKAKIIGKETKVSKQELKVREGGKILASLGIYPRAMISVGNSSLVVKRPLKRVLISLQQQRLITSNFEDLEFSKSYSTKKSQEELNLLLFKKMSQEFNKYKSIIISANTPYEAINKANQLLYDNKINSNLLEAELINEKVYRVNMAKVEGPWSENWTNNFYKDFAPSEDGWFKIENKIEGLYLFIKYPRGGGKKIEFESIKKEIEKKGYKNIDYQKILSALSMPEKNYQEIRIADMQFTEEVGGIVKVSISEDKKHAYIRIIPPTKTPVLLTLEHILERLKDGGVNFGIDRERIKKALEDKEYNRDIQIASAQEPTKGKDGFLAYAFKNITKF